MNNGTQPGLRVAGTVLAVAAICGLLISCPGGGSGDSGSTADGIVTPPAVIGVDVADDDPGTPGIQFSFQFTVTQSIQLELDAVDPDAPAGYTVDFLSDPLPSYFSLDANTGIVTFTPDGSVHTDSIDFWSEDSLGENTSTSPLRIDFTAFSS